jgi:hypothetical protein
MNGEPIDEELSTCTSYMVALVTFDQSSVTGCVTIAPSTGEISDGAAGV